MTGKSLGANIDAWHIRSAKCSDWAKASRLSGCSAIVLDPNDKLGPAARNASGNLAPKPLLFFAADARAITLWRLACAFNAADADTAAVLFAQDGELAVNESLTWKGPGEIAAGLKEKFAEWKGLVRAELGLLSPVRHMRNSKP